MAAIRRSDDRRRRRHLAGAFETALADAVRPARAYTARAPVARGQVLTARSELEQVVARLRDPRRAVDPAALLVARDVLCDPAGPLYVERPAGALRARLELVRAVLD